MSASPAETGACPNCGGDVPHDARFCPTCGARLQAGSTAVIPPPPDETGRVPVSIASAEPHLFGVTPPLASFVLGVASLAVGVLLLGLGRLVAGLLLLASGALLLGIFMVKTRDERARTFADRLRLAAMTVGTRSAASREATRLRHELAWLDGERADRVHALGEAVHAGSEEQSAALRDELAALEERIAGLQRELELLPARAHEQVARAKLEVQPTEHVERLAEPDRAQD
jgi:Double zinc ribbon